MTLHITPEIGISAEIPSDSTYLDLRARAQAACNTSELLAEHGLDITLTELDKDIAAVLVESFARDTETASKSVTNSRTATLTPACLIQTHQILSDFGSRVAHHSEQIRHMVTNKLINESENPDARIRLRALELLGKISDVGLFSDKKEITVTHRSPIEIRAKLREKLDKLQIEAMVEEAEYEEVSELEDDAA